MSFTLPPLQDNPDGAWGPSPLHLPAKFKEYVPDLASYSSSLIDCSNVAFLTHRIRNRTSLGASQTGLMVTLVIKETQALVVPLAQVEEEQDPEDAATEHKRTGLGLPMHLHTSIKKTRRPSRSSIIRLEDPDAVNQDFRSEAGGCRAEGRPLVEVHHPVVVWLPVAASMPPEEALAEVEAVVGAGETGRRYVWLRVV